jgi:hypothetical protein
MTDQETPGLSDSLLIPLSFWSHHDTSKPTAMESLTTPRAFDPFADEPNEKEAGHE